MQTTHIVLVAILPRAGWTVDDKWAYPNRFTTPISQVNDYIQVCPKSPSTVHDARSSIHRDSLPLTERVTLLQEGKAFLTSKATLHGIVFWQGVSGLCWQHQISQVGCT